MQFFDLHPKAAIYASKKSAAGGLLTISTVVVAFVLIAILGAEDLTQRYEDLRVNTIAHDETIQVELDISFIDVQSCHNQFQVEVVDALGRKVNDPSASLDITYSPWSKRCRLQGTLHVSAGKGTFRIYPMVLTSDIVSANHRIDGLLFGTDVLRSVPKDARVLSTPEAHSQLHGAWSYYLSLVPTTANGVNGYQIAATRTFIQIDNVSGPRGSLFFYYEASPIRMHVDSKLTTSKVFHFIARSLGIVSGLFAFVGAFREVFFSTEDRVKPKKASSLVM